MAVPAIETVGDLMSGDLLFLAPDESTDRARHILATTGLHAIPIVENDEALGMVTLADCHGRDADDALGEIMAGPPVMIDVGATISEAATLMRSNYVHHLIVTEGENQTVVGLVSSYDLLAMLVN